MTTFHRSGIWIPRKWYQKSPYYRALFEAKREVLEKPAQRRVQLMHDPRIVRARSVKHILVMLYVPLLISLLFKSTRAYAALAVIANGCFLHLAGRRLDRVEKEVRKEVSGELQALVDAANKAYGEIEEEWNLYCTAYSGYPPDWSERRAAVLDRDGHRCRQCGKGYVRRALERRLHIHHVVPLGRGGNHALSNLITLCLKCHRQEEKPKHGSATRQ